MIQITATKTVTHHTVKDGDRMLGTVWGSEADGWDADYWIPVTIDGLHYGQYTTKRSPLEGTARLDNQMSWLADQDALYRDRPQVAMLLTN